MSVIQPFTEAEMDAAAEEWGANCGPASLAFALQIPIASVRGAIPQFEERRYTSPTMMLATLEKLNQPIEKRKACKEMMFAHELALVRIQWTGPWTAPGANAKWAYKFTHWICTYDLATVFDCNGGRRSFVSWEKEIVPLLTAFPRADGGWYPTHVWRIVDERHEEKSPAPGCSKALD